MSCQELAVTSAPAALHEAGCDGTRVAHGREGTDFPLGEMLSYRTAAFRDKNPTLITRENTTVELGKTKPHIKAENTLGLPTRELFKQD